MLNNVGRERRHARMIKNGWISPDVQLPAENVRVLVYGKSTRISGFDSHIATFKTGQWIKEENRRRMYHVFLWRHLLRPTIPAEGNGKPPWVK